jgi:hypothetical protein
VCGELETCCLAFHHLDPAEKSFTIGSHITRAYYTEADIRSEAAKCVVLCFNCHAKVHAELLDLPHNGGEGILRRF